MNIQGASKATLKKIERVKAKLAKDRDELRDLISDLQQLDDDATEALDSLEYAADALSRLL